MNVVDIHSVREEAALPLPLMLVRAPAGFPSPAEDHCDRCLDLNEHLIRHPAATFFVRAEGDSMTGAGILSGALLIVDRAEEAVDGRVVIALVEGCHTVKRFRRRGGRCWLEAAHPDYPDIAILDDDSRVWGVVTHAINRL